MADLNDLFADDGLTDNDSEEQDENAADDDCNNDNENEEETDDDASGAAAGGDAPLPLPSAVGKGTHNGRQTACHHAGENSGRRVNNSRSVCRHATANSEHPIANGQNLGERALAWIRTATQSELREVNLIGEIRSERLLEARYQFHHIDDVMQVESIGEGVRDCIIAHVQDLPFALPKLAKPALPA